MIASHSDIKDHLVKFSPETFLILSQAECQLELELYLGPHIYWRWGYLRIYLEIPDRFILSSDAGMWTAQTTTVRSFLVMLMLMPMLMLMLMPMLMPMLVIMTVCYVTQVPTLH